VIKILDNFFDDEKYKQVMHHIKNNVYFTPRFLEKTKDREEKIFYGERFILNSDNNLLNTFITQSEKKFNFKIKEVDNDCGIDLRNLDRFIPHNDESSGKINILVMLDGPVGVTTGTVFYNKGESLELDIHVGFRPNRAVLFPSNHFHSSHKCELKGIRRYTSTLFITKYENLS
jgi:hypothetical protein|tara:strand:- start:49 stop:570 length:522 start_codon:yes stop_codon:yes gene_type:complete